VHFEGAPFSSIPKTLDQAPQKHKIFKNSPNPFGTKRKKFLGRAGFHIEIFFPKFENGFKTGFSRTGV
jgi:hypothetical protein